MSNPATVNFSFRKGDKASAVLTFLEGGSSYDVSGYSSWQLKLFKGGSNKLTATSEISVSTNVVTIAFDTAGDDYQDLSSGVYRYALEAIITGDTLPTDLFVGTWHIQDESEEAGSSSDSATVEIGATSVAVTVTTISASINALTGLTITSVADLNVIQYNGSAWVNRTLAAAGIARALGLSASVTSGSAPLAVTFTISGPHTGNLTEWFLRREDSMLPLDDTYKTSGTTQAYTFTAASTYRIRAFGTDASGNPYHSGWVKITVS